MNCPKCGALLEEDSKYCASCGANLSNSNADESTPVVASAQIEKEKSLLKLKIQLASQKRLG
ncbi:MAG: zinc-ribbon domain-containing protein [Oscillospiraceae bacterium]|nr:zinc-ribbon domain-containing protein [Oscillospiraceae bacterium]